jgi:hypothetical protein
MTTIPNEDRPSIAGRNLDTPINSDGWKEETYRMQQTATDEYKDGTGSNEFDVRKFNKDFEKKLAEQRIKRQEEDLKKLHATEIIEPKKIHELSLAEILARITNVIFDILSDFFIKGFKLEYLTKDDRLIYLGLCILFIIIIYNSLAYIFLE